jgi:predicted metal-binding protein
MPFQLITPIIQPEVRNLCVKPYPGHPKGCPNFNKNCWCPPTVELFQEVADLTKPIYVIWNEFDFGEHCAKMRLKHPNWSQRQVECCLYWQGTARKQLSKEIDKFKEEYKADFITRCPEAMGINVTETMKSIGILLEWPPVSKTYQVAIAYSVDYDKNNP